MRGRDGARLRSGDDARGGQLEGMAIALGLDGASEVPVLVLERALFLDPQLDLAELLAPLWQAQPPPYLVFADAHRALGVLAERGVSAPARFGCATVAGTLLGEGADRRRDHRPLDRSVREFLERELPDGLLTLSSTGTRLASEAEALLELLRTMTPMLRDRSLAKVYSFECSLIPAVVAMEAAGIGVDAPGFERIAGSWVRERAELDVDAETEGVVERAARLDKLISTYRYWARDYVGPDQRMRCRLHPLAADSGRFSCTEPNLQQVPAEHTAPGLRACFVAAKGHKLIIADYAQIELRVAAHLAPCEAMRAVFRAGRDPHRATAANLAGKPEHEVDSHERKLAKAVNFGFLFGMGARRFAQYARDSYGLELDERQAAAAREAFFRTFPGIAAWHRRIGALSRAGEREDITVVTAMGRRRTFLAGKFSFNAALNIPVQGTAAEGFKIAMLRLQPALAEIGGRGVLVVHDEYIAEVPEEHAERGRGIVEQVMVAAMGELVDSVPILVEAAIADHWG
ncbi:DNA polymerase I [Enhygromyxa salina]|uniref:DNA-directed DNA polymerase n=1 Tax=Enhygromyxa salina TaxID=215803 RepID=A0A0C2D258_9BACT|nr:DNA polymerase [Enhygromyxa salina]KIG17346.1 DNA polymerase I [Enhygromyxa salina]